MAWRVNWQLLYYPGTPDAPHPPWVHQQRRGRNGDPAPSGHVLWWSLCAPCGPRNRCRAVGEPPVNLLESGALWRDFGPGVGENASSDPFQLQYMCPEVGGPKSNNLGANLIGGGRGERRHAGPMPMAFPPGEREMDSSSWWPSPAKGVVCKLESAICHGCRLDSPAGCLHRVVGDGVVVGEGEGEG